MRTLFAALCLLAVAAVSPAAAPPALPPADAWGDPLPEDAVARLGSDRFRGGCVDSSDLALSADGKLIATLENDGSTRIVLIDAATGRRLRSFAADGVRSVAFAGAGKELACSCDVATVRFLDVAQGKELRKFQVQEVDLAHFALSSDGRALAACTTPRVTNVSVSVYDVKTGKTLTSLASPHNAWVGLALSSEGKYLATCSLVSEGNGIERKDAERLSRTVFLWDVATGKEWKKLEVEEEQVIKGMAFSPDGKTLAIHVVGELQLWDLTTGKRREAWLAPSWREGRLTISPDGKRLVLTPIQLAAAPAVWDLETNRRLRSARSPNVMVAAVGFRGDAVVALGSRWRSLLVWDVLSGKRFDRDDDRHAAPITAIHAGTGRILTADPEGKLLAWSLSGRLIGKAQHLGDRGRNPWYVWGRELAAFSPDGGLLASAAGGGETMLHSVSSGEERYTLPRGHERQLVAPVFSPDGKLLASPAHELRRNVTGVVVHHTDSGKSAMRLETGVDWLGGLAIDPASKRLAVALMTQGDEENVAAVLVWRLDTGKQDAEFRRFEMRGLTGFWPNCSLSFSPDGSLLAVDGGLGTIPLLDATTGKRRATIENGSKSLLAPAFSPDGRSLAVIVSRGEASVLTLWELRSGKKRWEAKLPGAPTALTFDPSGRLLITAHADTTALLWDVSGRWRTDKVRDDEGWDALVKDLSSADAQKAFAAQRALAASGDLGVGRLAKRVKPAGGRSLSGKEIAALVKDLDDDDPDVRGKAADALEEQGKAAEAALRKALAGKPSAQLKRAAAALLDRLRQASPEELRASRTIEVLKWIATSEAKRLLADYARGRPDATLTTEAKAALSRLSR